MNLSKLQEMVKDRGAWHADVHGVPRVGNNSVIEQQQQDLANGWVEVLGVRVSGGEAGQWVMVRF